MANDPSKGSATPAKGKGKGGSKAKGPGKKGAKVRSAKFPTKLQRRIGSLAGLSPKQRAARIRAATKGKKK